MWFLIFLRVVVSADLLCPISKEPSIDCNQLSSCTATCPKAPPVGEAALIAWSSSNPILALIESIKALKSYHSVPGNFCVITLHHAQVVNLSKSFIAWSTSVSRFCFLASAYCVNCCLYSQDLFASTISAITLALSDGVKSLSFPTQLMIHCVSEDIGLEVVAVFSIHNAFCLFWRFSHTASIHSWSVLYHFTVIPCASKLSNCPIFQGLLFLAPFHFVPIELSSPIVAAIIRGSTPYF